MYVYVYVAVNHWVTIYAKRQHVDKPLDFGLFAQLLELLQWTLATITIMQVKLAKTFFCLVGGFIPSEKCESQWEGLSIHEMENKNHVWNHPSVIYQMGFR